MPTVSRDASEDVTPESKSIEGAATPAASQINERVRERSPMDVIGPGNFQKIKLLGKGAMPGLFFLSRPEREPAQRHVCYEGVQKVGYCETQQGSTCKA